MVSPARRRDAVRYLVRRQRAVGADPGREQAIAAQERPSGSTDASKATEDGRDDEGS
jgi:hypothetical protein